MTTALNIIFVLGLLTIAVGVGLIYPPAGLIVGGGEAVATVVLMARGDERQKATAP